ncbi:hypothetical protein [Halopiger djelfimassiliensis]|uniref:hypothetical protein n=1 Tax=Halopiger djelfimassiliensis TaxID=1293047 RepID=UPI000677F74A|nr:hypothetical protein [Halopiger djelfimassiliensis]
MFGTTYWTIRDVVRPEMNPFSRATTGDDAGFDDWDAFVPENLPDPGPFLAGHDLLDGAAHVDFHRLTRELFEQRGVYDATFGYNLAKLSLDRRHPDAGFRYAIDADDPTVLRAEFTPTTEFCPQADALVKGSFRAWNGLSDRHEYDIVRVRVHPSHHQADPLNETLERLERELRETGRVPGDDRERADDAGVESPF